VAVHEAGMVAINGAFLDLAHQYSGTVRTEIGARRLQGTYKENSEEMKRPGLDATDIRILSAMQQHGQLSKTKLAEIVNISATPCWARLDRLKAAGLINGFHADIVLEHLCDFTQVVVTVSLTHHRKASFDRFESFVRAHDEITECVATGGGMDYVMKVITPNLAAFQSLMQMMVDDELGVDRYMTYLATRTIKAGRPNLARLITGSDK
jgi:Lrp/AsnC family transcriptional regulator of ectoine degradation